PAFAGAPYDFRQVQWALGDSLSYSGGLLSNRGPVRVDPNALGATGIPEAYWLILPTDGLIVYETESNIKRALDLGAAAVTAIEAARFLLRKYQEAQTRGGGRRLPHPYPIPVLAEVEPTWLELTVEGRTQ